MNENLTQITIILDRSGSMSSVRDATISGFNEFVLGQKSAAGTANLTLIQFDSENSQEVVFDRAINEIPKLTAEQFVPRGGTPLHDAMGRAITELGAKILRTPEAERPGKVVIVTMTDGQENASREYESKKIAAMIKHQQDVYKWQFLFLGANQDAILTGERLGIHAMNSVTYSGTLGSVTSTLASTSSNLTYYRNTSDPSALRYTEIQRKDAAEEVEVTK